MFASGPSTDTIVRHPLACPRHLRARFALTLTLTMTQMYASSGQAMEEWMLGMHVSRLPVPCLTHLALKKAARITAAVPSGAPITPGTDDTVRLTPTRHPRAQPRHRSMMRPSPPRSSRCVRRSGTA
jgi:hypothetical protein